VNVLVIGSSGEALALVRALAGSIRTGLVRPRVRAGNVNTRSWKWPDWVLVATPDQRRLALRRFRLPMYRVVELPELASLEALRDRRVDLEVALTRMVEIGANRPVSRLGVGLAGLVVQAWKAAVERRARVLDGAPFELEIERMDREAKEAARAAAREESRIRKGLARNEARVQAIRAKKETRANARRDARLRKSS
jgi:hypothetical protein